MKAQGRVTERLVELRAALGPAVADVDEEGKLVHTDLDEMD
eukprot:COSAG02_NODE_44852_length_362_cov_0.939163_1_plen_41_part_00